ncbi:energy transducer TonB [Bacteroides sp. 519]|uniref:energy transducer TonB n=1 Tax=Bacteroides sp. 519 TaxID=2302937 RepID=UPI0013D622A9|nr:energy transducer TonB [Bacteroides sp. 519]NDV60067.1 energy transducer TonB [Bacteroides sp. 519]
MIKEKSIRIILTGIFVSLSSLVFAQEEEPVISLINRNDTLIISNTVFAFDSIDVKPEFPGGQKKLMEYLNENTRYKQTVDAVHTRVIVKFIIEEDGSITNLSVIRSLDPFLDREAIRVVSSMPKWKPGYNNGVPVRTWCIVPVSFRIQ